jgi:heme o synthase
VLVGTGLTGVPALRASLMGEAGWGGWGGWALFTLMFVWQIPHFLAIAWMYRDDYAKGGYKVLPVVDPTGTSTSGVIMLWTATLLMATLGPAVAMPDQLGAVYLTVAVVTGVPFFFAAVRLARRRMRSDARQVFFASIIHLPLLLVAMVVDGLIGAV